MNDKKNSELFELANLHLEGTLQPHQREQLESLISSDPDFRRAFVDFMHDHATLHWQSVGEGDAQVIDFPHDCESVGNRNGLFAAVAAIAILAAGLMVLVLKSGPNDPPPAFATMEKTSAARWESGSLPTMRGARLSAGSLKLADGLATLKFDSGAEVILEAPAEIQLIDGMNCRLASGTAVAEIPDTALGFTIETPAANVVDYGTRFAVNVDGKNGATKTQVFEGLVEVEHPETGKIVRLETGERNFVAGDEISDASAGPDEGEWANETIASRRGKDWRVLPSARDSYVYSVDVGNHTSDVLLLLKNSRDKKGPHRKAFLGFNLSKIDLEKIEDAELILNFTPTGWGLASVVPDATFSVYGITDSNLDDWNFASMTWENAPANDSGSGNRLLSEKAIKLGEFMMEQGIQRGQFGIRGEQLAEFLKTNRDGFATIAIVRDTEENAGGGLVHGIASLRHPTLPAPTLAIQLAD